MSENKQIYLIDTPNIEKDHFKIHTNIAETLYEIIKNHKFKDNSFTIGLFGEWGSGKSFIINKLKEKFKSKKDITFLNIDVWKYSGHPLLRSILFDIDNQLKKKYKENEKTGSESGNKYKNFETGYKNDNGKSLKDLLYYDEVFESELKATKPIEEYINIFDLIDFTKDENDKKLLYNIVQKVLERNKTLSENYFGIKIVEKIYEKLNEVEKEKIKELIKENDNLNNWDEEYLEIIKNLGIIESEKDL